MKKFLIVFSFLIVLGLGAFGTYHFYSENKNQIEQNAILTQQNAQTQAQLNAIGSMTTVYRTASSCYSGKTIQDSDLVAVSIPVSATGETTVLDKSSIIGKCYKINLKPGTIITTDLLMEENEGTRKRYSRELTFDSVPVGTVAGDYVDIRFLLPNAEELVVIEHAMVERIEGTTITIKESEEEHHILNAMFADLGNYANYVLAYMVKYLEPGYDTNTIAYYPVQHEMENAIRFNPNIEDATRCINTTLRDHIDEVLLVYTDSKNQQVASSFIANMTTQHQYTLATHQKWIADHTDEETGELVVEGSDLASDVGTSGSSGSVNFDASVGDAMDSLEGSLNELGGLY